MKKRRIGRGFKASSIQQHKKVGKRLIPPMLHRIPGTMQFSSWVNERLPEYLWACLLVDFLGRKEALAIFEKVSALVAPHITDESSAIPLTTAESSLPQLTLSELSKLAGDGFKVFLQTVTDGARPRAALRPMLYFEDLPEREAWAAAIGEEPIDGDLNVLAKAVLNTLDHQSQNSTDVRWLAVIFPIFLGRMQMPTEMLHWFRDYMSLDPSDERMRHIRPNIRACEMSMRGGPDGKSGIESVWSRRFWSYCMENTQCIRPEDEVLPTDVVDGEALFEDLQKCASSLYEHYFENRTAEAPDARTEALFGFGFYGVSLLFETLLGGNRFGISGRLLLRSLVEVRITLAYLCMQKDVALWGKFRQFGVGQTKLALLKMDAAAGAAPDYLEVAELDAITNEDRFEEFIEVDLGHWCAADLRKMAEIAGVKEDYDAYYGWPSAFVHGSWAALRRSALVVCENPLHRLHKIPSGAPRHMASTVADATFLLNGIFSSIDSESPGFKDRIGMTRRQDSGLDG